MNIWFNQMIEQLIFPYEIDLRFGVNPRTTNRVFSPRRAQAFRIDLMEKWQRQRRGRRRRRSEGHTKLFHTRHKRHTVHDLHVKLTCSHFSGARIDGINANHFALVDHKVIFMPETTHTRAFRRFLSWTSRTENSFLWENLEFCLN